MNLEDFLNELASFASLRLIGPLCNSVPPSDLPLIYIDGGLQFKNTSAPLSYSIGDGDSSLEEPEHLLPHEKDFSDFEFALSHIPNPIEKIHLHGFLGGRRDHEWINVGVIHNFLIQRDQKTQVFWENEFQSLSKGQWTFDYKGLFSVLSLEDNKIQIEGDVRYPCGKEKTFPRLSSLGLSNVSNGKFSVKCEKPCLILWNF